MPGLVVLAPVFKCEVVRPGHGPAQRFIDQSQSPFWGWDRKEGCLNSKYYFCIIF